MSKRFTYFRQLKGNSDRQDIETEEERWGNLAKYAPYGRHGDTKNDFTIIPRQEAYTKYFDYEHVAHAMFYARDDRVLWYKQPARAAVLMQMRFDERLGFPGGHVNNGEDTVTGLNRKMQEKIGLDINRYGFTENNYVVTYIHDKKKFVLHFFAKKISSEELKDIECNCVYAQEYGRESFSGSRLRSTTFIYERR
ncbi:U8 snoRNA-decapping enzyme-like isoform X2 [Mercenaria mercenaria]|uniref:U8 snoRNA-decapping enzyme-like isoform X2 n=1 Tax=Mercenaria mercenaria TaxID=6596 RepID=UPI00234E5A94|nr:U8 snoRNA-decapping enzyme-like isoform X2 [Mercenaria mercenaria]